MNIKETSELLNTLLSQTDKKSEINIYNCFIRVLSSLKDKDLSKIQSQLIAEKLSSLNLKNPTENRNKFYTHKYSEFKTFLKNTFLFTPEKHFTETGMIYGMTLGSAIGLSLGVAFSPSSGTAIGLSIGTGVGMVLGMAYGARRDAEAKSLGRVI